MKELLNENHKKTITKLKEVADALPSQPNEGSNDFIYALKGVITELSHLGTDDYFDFSYCKEKLAIMEIYEREVRERNVRPRKIKLVKAGTQESGFTEVKRNE